MAATSAPGPMILSVRTIRAVLHDGSVVEASRIERPKIFFGVNGGDGAQGMVVEIELGLAENKRLRRVDQVIYLADYWVHPKNRVRNDAKAVFHHADIRAPHYGNVRAVSWVEADDAPNTASRRQRPAQR